MLAFKVPSAAAPQGHHSWHQYLPGDWFELMDSPGRIRSDSGFRVVLGWPGPPS